MKTRLPKALRSSSALPNPEIPPLIKGYMRAGAWVCGEPAWDPDFNTADLLLLLLPMARVGLHLFQSAIDAAVPVVPLALRYTDRAGNPSRAPAYDGDVTLWQCLRAIARAEGLTADLRVLEAIGTEGATRRDLSAQCHAAIAWRLGQRGFMPHTQPDEIGADSDIEMRPVVR